MTVTTDIQQQLFALQDPQYRKFHSSLIPTLPPERFIGVRMPAMRRLAKKLTERPDIIRFLNDLPHFYYDENILHGLILCEEKNYDETVRMLNRWLPFVDNWATCDLIRPKAFRIASKNNADVLLSDIRRWMDSDAPYTVRFGIEMLMTCFLDDKTDESTVSSAYFRKEYLDWVVSVNDRIMTRNSDTTAGGTHRSLNEKSQDAASTGSSLCNHYYVCMMIAWFFATALAKQYELTLPYIERKVLSPWVHNKTIQKAVESFRITPAQKACLKTLFRR